MIWSPTISLTSPPTTLPYVKLSPVLWIPFIFVKYNMDLCLRDFTFDVSLSLEHSSPWYQSLWLSPILQVKAQMSSLWEAFPDHLYKRATLPSFIFLYSIHLFFFKWYVHLFAHFFNLTRMKTAWKREHYCLFYLQ